MIAADLARLTAGWARLELGAGDADAAAAQDRVSRPRRCGARERGARGARAGRRDPRGERVPARRAALGRLLARPRAPLPARRGPRRDRAGPPRGGTRAHRVRSCAARASAGSCACTIAPSGPCAARAGPNSGLRALLSPGELTPREIDVMRLVRGGNTSARIADTLGIGRATVDSHVRSAMAKTGARTRLQASMIAAQLERGEPVELHPRSSRIVRVPPGARDRPGFSLELSLRVRCRLAAASLEGVTDSREAEPYAVSDGGAQRARCGRVAVTPYALRLASALWETSSMLLIAGDEAVAVDPGVTQAGDRGGARSRRVGGRARRRRGRDARRLRSRRRDRVVPRRRGGHGSARSRSHRERSRAARDGRGGSAARPLLARFAALRPSPPCRAPRARRPVRDRDDGARGPHRRRHRPAPARPRRPDRRRLPVARSSTRSSTTRRSPTGARSPGSPTCCARDPPRSS